MEKFMQKDRLYTEKELLKAIEYACGYQKADSYQWVANIVLKENKREPTPEELETLDYLWDCDINGSKDITLEDINEYLDEDNSSSK